MFAKLPATLKTVREIRDLLGGTDDKIRICSLSSSLNDVRLWSYYADGHTGIVLEIDPSGLEAIHEVTYSEELPMGMAGGITLLGQITPREVLCRKTNHWEFEKEYRIIADPKNLGEHKYCDIKGRIKAVYLGTRTSETHRDLLTRIVPAQIPIWTTKVNPDSVMVVAADRIRTKEQV
jgi:hypothetical protein